MISQSPELTVAVEKPRSWARRLTITVPSQRVQQARQEVARSWAQKIKLPGFRPGRIPTSEVERRFGPAIDQEMIERLVNEAFREALEREHLEPITQGEIEKVDYQPGQDLTFDVEFEVRPEIDLERIGGFHVQREAATVGEGEVDRVLDQVREQHATWHPIEEEAPVNGDMVVVEITPLAEEGAAPRQYEIVLGAEQALPPVEEAIRSLKPGEENEFTLQLPDPDAEEEGATREDRVRIRLTEAKRAELPALDDEFARSLGDYENVDVLRARVRSDLEREAEAETERMVRHRLLEQIVEANPFEVPDSLIHRYVERIVRSPRGADAERIAEARRLAQPAAEQALRRMMIIERVAEVEGLHATSAEVDERVESLAERHGRPVGEVWAQLQKSGQLSALEEEITEEKVFEYLKSQSTIE